MARWSPARADVLSAYAREILEAFPRGRLLVGIDGLDGAGKTTFARDLAAAVATAGVAAATVSVDDFQSARAERGDPPTADSWYERGFDHALLRERVVEPYRAGRPVALLGRDLAADRLVADPPRFLPGERAILVVEGIFLHRRELRDLWHTSAWLDVPVELAVARCVARDGWDPAPDAILATTFFAAEDRYLREADPRRRARAVFDLTDAQHPLRRFDDAC